LSDDGRHGLTLIAFLGSVFSPYYAAARRRAGRRGEVADPLDHCAINVALYGGRSKHWAMTERGRGALARDRSALSIGPSSLVWDGRGLSAEIAEWTVPRPRRLRGEIRLRPDVIFERAHRLDPGPGGGGDHRWWPIAPCARVEVDFAQPALRWSGRAYLDSNRGEAPLEQAFRRWQWSRSTFADGSTAVVYDVVPRRRAGPGACIARRFTTRGGCFEFEPPPPVGIRPTFWRIDRTPAMDPPLPARACRSFEDAPFYARSQLEGQLLGEAVETVHESLDLDRFRQRWVQGLLPFRMPRAAFLPRRNR